MTRHKKEFISLCCQGGRRERKATKSGQVFQGQRTQEYATMVSDIQSLKLTLVVYWPISSGQQFNSEILFQQDNKRTVKSSVLGAGPRGLPVVLHVGLWQGLLHCK